MKRPLASALAFLIVALSPGAPAYQAFAQTVGKTGSATGAAGDAATSVNSGINNGGLAAPLALPVQTLGLNSALAPSAVPVLNSAVVPALTPSVAAVTPAASLSQPAALRAASPAAAKPLVPGALQPAAKTANAPAGLSAASKQVETLSQSAKPVLEGVKSGDATAALNVVFENGSQRGQLGAVMAPSGPAALRSGLKRSAPSAAPQGPAEVPSAQAPAAKPSLWQRIRSTFDLSEFNKSEKSYIAGQAVFLLAISVYLASLPLLVSALTGDAAMTGVARMVHYWVFGGASLFAGAVVSKTPMKRILVGAAGGRALLFGSIGALALFGGLPCGF